MSTHGRGNIALGWGLRNDPEAARAPIGGSARFYIFGARDRTNDQGQGRW